MSSNAYPDLHAEIPFAACSEPPTASASWCNLWHQSGAIYSGGRSRSGKALRLTRRGLKTCRRWGCGI